MRPARLVIVLLGQTRHRTRQPGPTGAPGRTVTVRVGPPAEVWYVLGGVCLPGRVGVRKATARHTDAVRVIGQARTEGRMTFNRE